MALICSSTVLETLGSDFDEYVYLPLDGTHGGILLAWKRGVVTIFDPMFTTNVLTAKVVAPDSPAWWISVVYGPQDDDDKVAFLQELQDV